MEMELFYGVHAALHPMWGFGAQHEDPNADTVTTGDVSPTWGTYSHPTPPMPTTRHNTRHPTDTLHTLDPAHTSLSPLRAAHNPSSGDTSV